MTGGAMPTKHLIYFIIKSQVTSHAEVYSSGATRPLDDGIIRPGPGLLHAILEFPTGTYQFLRAFVCALIVEQKASETETNIISLNYKF